MNVELEKEGLDFAVEKLEQQSGDVLWTAKHLVSITAQQNEGTL